MCCIYCSYARALADAVLYQWEMTNIPLEVAMSYVTPEFVAVHQRFPVWDDAQCALRGSC